MAVLLHRLGAGDDLTIGCPATDRTEEALTDLVGFLVNTWVLRLDLTRNPSFSDLLGTAATKALNAYDLHDVPFERLVELIAPSVPPPTTRCSRCGAPGSPHRRDRGPRAPGQLRTRPHRGRHL
ncbi:condensation domain-containing protein [Streptomyces cirratus]